MNELESFDIGSNYECNNWNVRICLIVGGEEEVHWDIDVVHRGIPHSGNCPPAGGAHDGGQYTWPEGGGWVLELWPGCPTGGGGGQYPAEGDGGGHIEVCPGARDPPHSITGVGPVWEPFNWHKSLTHVWLRIWILNWKWKKIVHVICQNVGSSDCLVHWDTDRIERGIWTTQITLIICYQIELDKLSILRLTCSIIKMCCWLCTRFWIKSSCHLYLSFVALPLATWEERVDEEVEVVCC
jgi:hypothetical protein